MIPEMCEENKRTLAANYAANKQYILAAPGVSEWAGRFQNLPVIVAGAGPSLDAALPLLAKTLHPIVACDRAVRPLLSAGIKPMCAVAVEMHALGAKKFEGAVGLEGVPLVFDPLCATETIKTYPGPKRTYNRPRLVSGKGDIRIGTGVVVSAVGVAALMGASKIILAGVDLAYPHKKTHANGVTVLDGEPFESHVPVRSANGGLVLSDVYFIAQAAELAQACSNGVELVQTSPRGAFIRGAEHMDLYDAL